MDFSNWLTEPEAARALHTSERNVRRMVAEGNGPERRYRERPGKKPEPVYNPRDVENLAAPAARVMPAESRLLPRPGVPAERQETALAPFFASVLDRLAGALEKFAPLPPAAEPKRWLTPAEAAEYLGLSEGLIRRLIRMGKLPCLRDKRGYIVARAHLDNLASDPSVFAGLSKLQQSTADLRQAVKARRAAL